MRSLCLILGFVVACGSGDDERHPAAPSTTGGTSSGSNSGGSSPRAGSSSTPDAGQGGDAVEPQAGAGGEGGSAGEPIIYEMGGKPMTTPGTCDPAMKLGDDQSVQLGVPGATLLSMTLDELTIAFTTGTGDALALYVADRASSDADFAELAVAVPDGYSASTGVALSKDGLTLILARDDGSGMAELTREARGATFGAEANEARFAKINASFPMTMRAVGWPVLGQDGKSLYYVNYDGDALVYQTLLLNGTFEIGKAIDEFTLGGSTGKHKLISSLAADQRAMFFLDQATQHATALFRSYETAPFYEPLDLGERQGASVNADCSRVYSTVEGNLVYQERE